MNRDPFDKADRRAFRNHVLDVIEDRKNSQRPALDVLLDKDGGWHHDKMGQRLNGSLYEWGSPGVWANDAKLEGTQAGFVELAYDASHQSRPERPGDNVLVIEDRAGNRSRGASLEKHEAPNVSAVEVRGLPVARSYAERLEATGMLESGLLASAPPVEGWSREKGFSSTGPSFQDRSDPAPDCAGPRSPMAAELAREVGWGAESRTKDNVVEKDSGTGPGVSDAATRADGTASASASDGRQRDPSDGGDGGV